MWQMMVGFAAGVYVGTYYNCKPTIVMIREMVKDKIPEKKEK
jgi:hypothetical protein